MPGGRPPRGLVAAKTSRTAVLLAVVAEARGMPPGGREQVAAEHRIPMKRSVISAAATSRRFPPPAEASTGAGERNWWWTAPQAHPTRLELTLVRAWLPRESPALRTDRAELLDALSKTPFITGLAEGSDDTVIVEAAVPTARAKADLQARLRELSPGLLWTELRDVHLSQPAKGWAEVLDVVADQERMR